MITLKYLRAENFKGLRSVSLLFPEQGSVLIEGRNEAGKSTLFEAVYVALYGKPLVGEEKLARQDEVIQHGQVKAVVQLAFNVGQLTLVVTRIFERGKTQQANLKVQRPDAPEESIQRAGAVNDRILKELGNLDGDSLRNSCFVEQKELGRIEDLGSAEREKAVQKLLGLDRLTRMMNEFKFTREQKDELGLAERRLRLAQLQAEEKIATAIEAQLRERLEAVKIAGHLRNLGNLEKQKAELEKTLRTVSQRIQIARERLERCKELTEQIINCDQVGQRLMSIDHARRELRRREEELAELQHIEQVKLPEERTHLENILATAEAVTKTIQTRQSIKQAKELLKLQQEVQHQEREAQSTQTAVLHAEREMQQAMNAVRLVRAYEVLTIWIRLKRVEVLLNDYVAQQALLLTRQQSTEAAFAVAHSKTRIPFYTAVSLTVLSLLSLILGLLWLPVLTLPLCLLVGSIFFWLRFVSARRSERACSVELARCKGELQNLEMQRQAAIQTGGDPSSLSNYEQQLQAASMQIPSDSKAGEQLQENLRQQLGTIPESHALQEAARSAQDNYIRLEEQLRQAHSAVEKSRKVLEDYERTTAFLHQEDGITPTKAQEALQQARNLVLEPPADDPEAQSAHMQEALSDAEAAYRQQEEFTLLLLQKINVQSETAVEAERGRAEAKVQALEEKYAAYPVRKEEYQEKKTSFGKELVVVSALLENLLAASHRLEVTKLPVLFNASYEKDTGSPHELTLRATLNAAKDALENTLAVLDEPRIHKTLEADLSEEGKIQQQVESGETEVLRNQKAIETVLTGRGLAHPSIYTSESLPACWPLIAAVSPDEERQVTSELEQTKKDLYALSQQVRSLAEELHDPGTPLDIDACQKKVDELREERLICEWGAKFIQETRDRIARHVLPITERNMQPLLQQLTDGRYRDVRLTPDESNSQSSTVDYRIRVWDQTAGRYVAKNLFSGGTRDQCSLALRLAFALATLPQELGVAPGFIFLDEPLSAFDAQRAQALVELLTTGIIARQFNQVILISHSHAFDRDAFHYHVHIEGGQVIESDLPQESYCLI